TGEQVLRELRSSYDWNQPLDDANNRVRLGGTARALVDRGDVGEVVVLDGAGKPILGQAGDDWALRSARGGTLFLARTGDHLYIYAPLPGVRGHAGAVRLRLPGDDELSR